jgi:hypothetical protein
MKCPSPVNECDVLQKFIDQTDFKIVFGCCPLHEIVNLCRMYEDFINELGKEFNFTREQSQEVFSRMFGPK